MAQLKRESVFMAPVNRHSNRSFRPGLFVYYERRTRDDADRRSVSTNDYQKKKTYKDRENHYRETNFRGLTTCATVNRENYTLHTPKGSQQLAGSRISDTHSTSLNPAPSLAKTTDLPKFEPHLTRMSTAPLNRVVVGEEIGTI